jgi:putative ABC transport system substrate-binding protein
MKTPALGTILALALLAVPVAPEAQPAAKVPLIGFLAGGPTPPVEEFRRGLHDLGYVEGKNILVERRWTGGKAERAAQLAAELVSLKPDVIVAVAPPPAVAMMNATSNIPVVFAAVTDPVALGLVASLARPGGNFTGVSWEVPPEVNARMVQILREGLPKCSRVAVLWNPANPGSERYFAQTNDAGRRLGVTVISIPLSAPDRLDAALQRIARARVDAIIVLPDPLTVIHRARIVGFAADQRLPDMYMLRDFTEMGGLMSYGPHLGENIHRAAYYVDRILKGTRPADLPVEQATKFEFVINLKTARALGLTIPPAVRLRADHVIQ